jgi:hypothetical protein
MSDALFLAEFTENLEVEAKLAQGLKERFLSPMHKEGLLGHRLPTNPNHEKQVYRTKKEAY